MEIDIAMPSYKGQDTILKSLQSLNYSLQYSPFEVNKIRFDTKGYSQEFLDKIQNKCEKYNWPFSIWYGDSNLPEAREFLVNSITTDWFLFLDDDVYLTPLTMFNFVELMGYSKEIDDYYRDEYFVKRNKKIGAIQIRRKSDNDPNHIWSMRRPVRGTLFATMIQTKAIKDISIPSDLTVLEDEYIRQYIENQGYLWLFDHSNRFVHDNNERHTIDFTEGKLAAKYNLLPPDYVFGNIPYQVIREDKSNLKNHILRGFGYLYGRCFL